METQRGRWVKPLIVAWTAAICLFLYMPVVAGALASLSQSRYFTFPIAKWSTVWWGKTFDSIQIRELIQTSVTIALVVTLISVAVAFFGALAFARYRWRGRSLAARYLLLHDRKGVLTAFASILAYLLVLHFILFHVGLATGWWHAYYPSLFEQGSFWRALLYINAIFLVIRAAHRVYFTTVLYGWEHGLMSLPRMVVGNFVNCMAVARAWKMYLSYLFRGTRLAWDKTAHEFPSSVQLARKRQRQRGFNQAALLARWLATPLRLPVQEHWLLRPRETDAQQTLDARARRARGAWRWQTGVAWEAGEAYLHPLYLTAGPSLQASGRYAEGRLEVSSAALALDGVRSLAANAVFDLRTGRLDDAGLAIADADLAVIGPTFIAPLVAPAQAGRLKFAGHASVGLRIIDGMEAHEHYGFDPRTVPEIFGSDSLVLEKRARFQVGLNHLFVFHRGTAILDDEKLAAKLLNEWKRFNEHFCTRRRR